MVSPDLRQNIIVMFYLLFSHNYIAFMYLAGLLLSIILSIYRPSRFTTFCFLGFAVLLFSFEYDKHIIAGLREQTMQSLITATPHFRLQRLIDVALSEIFPILFYMLGWGFLFLAIIKAALETGRKKRL